MKVRHWGIVLPMIAVLAAFAQPATAATALFVSPQDAAQACGADEVVWVDLDKGRFYHKAQSEFGASKNGGYACGKAAHAQYREAH